MANGEVCLTAWLASLQHGELVVGTENVLTPSELFL